MAEQLYTPPYPEDWDQNPHQADFDHLLWREPEQLPRFSVVLDATVAEAPVPIESDSIPPDAQAIAPVANFIGALTGFGGMLPGEEQQPRPKFREPVAQVTYLEPELTSVVPEHTTGGLYVASMSEGLRNNNAQVVQDRAAFAADFDQEDLALAA